MDSRLIVTLGDPLSVNIELIGKQLAALPSNTILVGSLFHWDEQMQALGIDAPKICKIQKWEESVPGKLHFLDIGRVTKPSLDLSSQERGALAVAALDKLKELAAFQQKNRIAILTMPIDKHACHEAGFRFPGHTEYFADLSQCPTLMLLAGPKLKVGLATNHLALSQVSAAITKDLVLKKLELLYDAMKTFFGIEAPKIAVSGLNPHCSDGGLFGNEETQSIAPAVKAFGKNVLGPLPADTVFYQAFHGRFDAVLAMYHDQGLGPLKTVHFDEAVNITCGLPYLRLSPDHGPAKDLFLQNKASTRSVEAALQLVHRYLGAMR